VGAVAQAESEAKFDAAQKQLQEFQAALQAEHADVVEKVCRRLNMMVHCAVLGELPN